MQIPFPVGVFAVFSALSLLWRVLRVADNFWLPPYIIQDVHTFALVLLKEPQDCRVHTLRDFRHGAQED